MHLSLMFILSSLFSVNFFFFFLKKNSFSHDIYCFLVKSCLKIIIPFLRLDSTVNNSIFLDFNAIERLDINGSSLKCFTLFYFFFMPSIGARLCLNFLHSSNSSVETLSQYFQGLNWAEREISEMFGINFDLKRDNRRLLLDYSFIGFPLLKNFSVIGYIELFYDFNLNSLAYIPLIMSESDKTRFSFYN